MCRMPRQTVWGFPHRREVRDADQHSSPNSRAYRGNSFWLWHSNRQPGNPLGRHWFSSRRIIDAVPRSKRKTIMADSVPAGTVVYFDGRYVLKNEVSVSPDDRGFLLGDGIYEVAAAYDGKFVALDRHMDRLRGSLREARIDDSVADPLEDVFTG